MCQTLVNLMPCCVKSPSGTKVPKLNMCRSITSLSKIVHQMWCNNPLSQRNKATERAVVVGFGRYREGEWAKLEKEWGRQ